MRIGLATHLGGYPHARVCDMALADALAIRGADPEFILCDGALPACQMTKLTRVSPDALVANGQESFCSKCFTAGVTEIAPRKHPVRMVSDGISKTFAAEALEIAASVPLSDIKSFRWRDLPIGEHTYAGALRYLARGDLEGEEFAEPILRRYLQSALLIAESTRSLIESRGYEVIVAHHGIYIPQGIAIAVAHSEGVRVVTYNPAYRRHSFIFSHRDTYHHTMLSEPVAVWRGMGMTSKMQADLDTYLASRRAGTNDWIWFHNEPVEDHRAVLSSLGADPDKPYVVALTSVIWDAQLHYQSNAFSTMIDWLIATVRAWQQRADELQLIIRVHPAEIRGAIPSRQRVEDELRKVFGSLPANVFIVPPDNEASTYAICDHANAVIVYNTKTGVEVAAAGKRVIVAGEAWIRGKGFSRDVENPEDYALALGELPYRDPVLPTFELELARKYAYHFFFRRMIPLPFIRDEGATKFSIDPVAGKDLRPGAWAGLDVICDGIINGSPFVYRAENMSTPFAHEDDRTV